MCKKLTVIINGQQVAKIKGVAKVRQYFQQRIQTLIKMQDADIPMEAKRDAEQMVKELIKMMNSRDEEITLEMYTYE